MTSNTKESNMLDPKDVKCYIDDEEVDCEELKYVPYTEEESYLDFLSLYDS
jgi:hypothetical protein